MKRRLTYANVVATLALFLALGGGSYAAITSGFGSGGVLHACATARNGSLRLVRHARDCRRGEVFLSWNVQGPAGKPGQTGQTGPPGPATGTAGGDLSGTYPNPTVATIGGHTPVTDATTAGGDLTGTFPNPQIAAGKVSSLDLAPNAAFCSATTRLQASPTGFCSGATTSFSAVNPASGVYCLTLPIGGPVGGSVSIDSASRGFPVAFMSMDPTTVAGSCGFGPNVLVTTYDTSGAGAALTNEVWYGFFY